MFLDDDMRAAIMDALVETGEFTFNYLAQLTDWELLDLADEYAVIV